MTVQSLMGTISMLFLCCGVAAPRPVEEVCSPDAHSLVHHYFIRAANAQIRYSDIHYFRVRMAQKDTPRFNGKTASQ